MKKEKIITIKLTQLIGKNVKGLTAQITNPIYLKEERLERWRELTSIKTNIEKGVKWVTLYWIRKNDDSCNFTGCTVESNICTIQFKESEFKKLK